MNINDLYVNVEIEVVYDNYESQTIAFSINGGPWCVMIIDHQGDD